MSERSNAPDPVQRLPGRDEVQARARRLFDAACEHLDPELVAGLERARREAVAHVPVRGRTPAWIWATAGAACCTVALALAWPRVLPYLGSPAPTPAAAAGATTLPDADYFDASPDQAAIVQNLDFYRWLAAQRAAPAAGSREGQ